jgi:ClpP class serine protease
MSKHHLLSQILKGSWFIEQKFADGFMPRVMDLLQRKPSAMDDEVDWDKIDEKHMAYVLVRKGNSFVRIEDESELTEGSIAVIGIEGPIMKADFCGYAGTNTMRQWLKDARENPKIGAVFIPGGSGGGAVDGTFEFVDEIAETAKVKPVIGFVDGMSASAMYAIHSACTAVYASHKTSEIGSIGVMVHFASYDKYYKKEGIELHYINAESSPDKNNDVLEAKKGNYKPIQDNSLTPLHTIFKDTVKRGRANIKDSAMTGKMYLAERAISEGLIDGIMSFEDAINEAYDMANSKSI